MVLAESVVTVMVSVDPAPRLSSGRSSNL